MKDPKTMPVVRVEFTLASGEVLERDWTMAETPPDLTEIPGWLLNPRRAWDHPQDPVTFRGDVIAGHEDVARAFVGAAA